MMSTNLPSVCPAADSHKDACHGNSAISFAETILSLTAFTFCFDVAVPKSPKIWLQAATAASSSGSGQPPHRLLLILEVHPIVSQMHPARPHVCQEAVHNVIHAGMHSGIVQDGTSQRPSPLDSPAQ